MKHLFSTSAAALALSAFLISGCADSQEDTEFTEVSPKASEQPTETAHAHPSEGPHGGELVELGNEEYHAELIHPEHHDNAHSNEAHKEHGEEHDGITIYILDGSATKTVAIDAADISLNLSHHGKPKQFKLAARQTESDKEGTSSRFVSADKELLGHFHEEHIDGTLVLTINGKSFRGKLAHSHDHGDGHADDNHASHHSHAGGDTLIWQGEPRELAGMQIQLGHHGKHLHAGEPVEPAVSITRDGKPVSDAKVHVSLLSEDGETVVAIEAATVFEPTSKEEPAHYAQGALTIPKNVTKVVIRFRVAVPGTDEATYNVSVDVE